MRERCIELRLRFADERVVVHVVDDADDRVDLGAVAAADAHAAVERVTSREIFLREGAVDNHRQRTAHVVADVEGTSLAQRESHRLEVARRHDLPIAGCALVRRRRVAVDLKSPIAHLGREREQPHGADAPNAWDRRDAALNLIPERGDANRVGIERRRRRETHRQHAIGTEAGIDRQQIPHASDHQTGGDDEHDRERDLGRDERLPPAEPRTAARRATSTLLELTSRRDLRCLQRGENARQQRGDDRRRQRECQHPPVERRFGDAWQAWWGVDANHMNAEHG